MKWLAASLLLVGCAKHNAPVAAQGPVDAMHEVQVRVSMAGFDGDNLVECDDIEFTASTTKTVDAVELAAKSDELWKLFSQKKPSSGVTITRLDRVCSEQFPDRPPFAVCSRMPLTPGMVGSIAHFSFARIFRSDAFMKECMESKGSWTSMPRNTPAFFQAEARFNAVDHERRIKKLMRAAGATPESVGLDN